MEKRKFNRISVNIKVSFKIVNEPVKKAREAVITNMSEGGVLILFDSEPLTVSAVLDLQIHAFYQPEPIMVRGRVVSIKEVIERKKYEMGVIFLDLSKENIACIKRLLRNSMVF